MRVGSLFSGIGGLDLGLERAGMSVVWQCELDDFCRAVLRRHWPSKGGPLLYRDVRDTEQFYPRVDLICGGFPCQPVSDAGKRQGRTDPRWLWPWMARLVGIVRPRYVLVENVPGLLSVNGGEAFGEVLGDLAGLGFDAEWSIVSACAVGAPHARERLFLLAYPEGSHVAGALPPSAAPVEVGRNESRGGRCDVRRDPWLPEPEMDRVADGLPRRVVRAPLSALGNAVVPQVAEWIGRRIMSAQLDICEVCDKVRTPRCQRNDCPGFWPAATSQVADRGDNE